MKTVFVGLSGGVDSSVAALRLKNQGYTVVGVFIKVWQPDFLECNWQAERLDAMRVAAHLDIPFLTCDAEAAYRDEVGKYFINEYKAGRTPNPDVLCNQHVKFGAFLEFAKAKGADFIATGHYAQLAQSSRSNLELHRGVDMNKDQTYFLWTLTQEKLKSVLFPVGDTPKAAIRAEAEAAKLPVATKKDSQGVCFLGHIDIPEFMSHFVTLVPGAVVNTEGVTVGEHRGALIYTIGQRQGFTITSQDQTRTPHFVIATNPSSNQITVSTTPPTAASCSELRLTNCSWVTSEPASGIRLSAQFRYRQTPVPVIYSDEVVSPQEETDAVASGQSCVLYDGVSCLGGGIIA